MNILRRSTLAKGTKGLPRPVRVTGLMLAYLFGASVILGAILALGYGILAYFGVGVSVVVFVATVAAVLFAILYAFVDSTLDD
jgi:hypothetical protein